MCYYFYTVIFNLTMSAISHVDTIMFVFTMYSYLQLNLLFVALIVEDYIILIANK